VTPDDAVVALLAALERADVPYMLVGSLASNFHGIPRSTRDADFVIDLAPGALGRLVAAFPPQLSLMPQTAFETVTGTVPHLVEVVGTPFVGELFMLSDDPHDRERFARRLRVQVLGVPAFVATAEDMIVTKLRWALDAGRLKDRDDVRSIIAVQGQHLDDQYIARWAATHGTAPLLDEIRRSLPSS
jgi:hypothetical protein